MKFIINPIRCLKAAALLTLVLLVSCTSSQEASPESSAATAAADDYGVLVMAHGGSAEWNRSVVESLGGLQSQYPVEIAFGMADAGSLEAAVRRLEAQGVAHAGVVRLFVSGESWYERTAQILGMQEGAPAKPAEPAHDAGHTGMAMGFWKIESDIGFHLSAEGLAEAEEMDPVLLSRVRGLSVSPADEVVAVIAHGPGDDDENARWIAQIGERTELMQRELGVRDVRVFTLREDWEEKREGAEALIRDYMQAAANEGLRPIVVPFRVQGFGPYADVLSGLTYHADHLGLTPHESVTQWIRNQADALREEARAHRYQLAASATP